MKEGNNFIKQAEKAYLISHFFFFPDCSFLSVYHFISFLYSFSFSLSLSLFFFFHSLRSGFFHKPDPLTAATYYEEAGLFNLFFYLLFYPSFFFFPIVSYRFRKSNRNPHYFSSSASFNNSVPASTNRPSLIIGIFIPSGHNAVISPSSSYGMVMSVWQWK